MLKERGPSVLLTCQIRRAPAPRLSPYSSLLLLLAPRLSPYSSLLLLLACRRTPRCSCSCSCSLLLFPACRRSPASSLTLLHSFPLSPPTTLYGGLVSMSACSHSTSSTMDSRRLSLYCRPSAHFCAARQSEDFAASGQSVQIFCGASVRCASGHFDSAHPPSGCCQLQTLA